MPSATIKLFLVHGDAQLLRTAELSNWSGKAVAGPRSALDALLERDEASKSGVYLLAGVDAESGRSALYVGEAESIRERLRDHLSKDFWNHVFYFVSKDENLTKAHIRYLEGRLIEQARAAARVAVVNSQASGAKLPESDREDMEVFLGKIHQLLPVLGNDALVTPSGSSAEGEATPMLVCEIKGLIARGRQSPRGFVVFKGSQAVLQERASANQYPNAIGPRRRMIEEGALVGTGSHYVFATDTEFTSPSAAATVVHGGSANGLISWKTADGRTLKELEAD